MNSVIEKILDQYGVEYTSISPPQKGYRNSSFQVRLKNGDALNVIIYKNEKKILNRIKAAHAVAETALSYGLPVRYAVDPKIIQIKTRNSSRFGALYNWLPGSTIPWEAYTMEHIKILGATLSELHRALKGSSYETLPLANDEYLAILQAMREYFLNPGVKSAMKTKLSLHVEDKQLPRIQKTLEYAGMLPHSQALHMDFVRGNVLFKTRITGEGSTKPYLTGILDFEKAAQGNPVFDIARSLAFLLVDCKYKHPDKVKKYFLQSGYFKRGAGTLEPIEMQFLEPLVSMFMLHDFYKFLLHNPYESLNKNEHFVCTTDQLITRGILLSH